MFCVLSFNQMHKLSSFNLKARPEQPTIPSSWGILDCLSQSPSCATLGLVKKHLQQHGLKAASVWRSIRKTFKKKCLQVEDLQEYVMMLRMLVVYTVHTELIRLCISHLWFLSLSACRIERSFHGWETACWLWLHTKSSCMTPVFSTATNHHFSTR